jgi:hypothetical protein
MVALPPLGNGIPACNFSQVADRGSGCASACDLEELLVGRREILLRPFRDSAPTRGVFGTGWRPQSRRLMTIAGATFAVVLRNVDGPRVEANGTFPRRKENGP